MMTLLAIVFVWTAVQLVWRLANAPWIGAVAAAQA